MSKKVWLSARNSIAVSPVEIASYQWRQIDGPSVSLEGSSDAQAWFMSPTGLSESGASLQFEVVLTDNEGRETSDSCIVNISWNNQEARFKLWK